MFVELYFVYQFWLVCYFYLRIVIFEIIVMVTVVYNTKNYEANLVYNRICWYLEYLDLRISVNIYIVHMVYRFYGHILNAFSI